MAKQEITLKLEVSKENLPKLLELISEFVQEKEEVKVKEVKNGKDNNRKP